MAHDKIVDPNQKSSSKSCLDAAFKAKTNEFGQRRISPFKVVTENELGFCRPRKRTRGIRAYGCRNGNPRVRQINLSLEHNKVKCHMIAEIAIAAFNEKFKEAKPKLKLDKVVMVNSKLVAGTLYYLTFDAIKLHKNCMKTYQAIVFDLHMKYRVRAFRLKPGPLIGIDGLIDVGNKWYWDDRFGIRDPA